jgi:hypothetical protein
MPSPARRSLRAEGASILFSIFATGASKRLRALYPLRGFPQRIVLLLNVLEVATR